MHPGIQGLAIRNRLVNVHLILDSNKQLGIQGLAIRNRLANVQGAGSAVHGKRKVRRRRGAESILAGRRELSANNSQALWRP
jgi:hypothetical protein